ncbi:hypothetical protein MAR_037622 [Mya arenaria]|uniref:Uncharacterized protein n=1 Tax=Mya arenaria TaxID=6604 RepID=A0ABY7FP00_MYAAR|nr:hypothetical protein MAR_037622 [Mya arenaria]
MDGFEVHGQKERDEKKENGGRDWWRTSPTRAFCLRGTASKPKKAITEEKTEILTGQFEGDVACTTSPKQCSSKDQTSVPAMIKASSSSSRSEKVLEGKKGSE